ncbi:MAG: hypothetical protein H0W36_11180 [Gemmatimonadetes bacterium]|nr:hypothetical protein [Gemmatimonadota bacterium]
MNAEQWRVLQTLVAFGMVSIVDSRFSWERDGGYHYELAIVGGKAVSAIGRTHEEAWANLLRALA